MVRLLKQVNHCNADPLAEFKRNGFCGSQETAGREVGAVMATGKTLRSRARKKRRATERAEQRAKDAVEDLTKDKGEESREVRLSGLFRDAGTVRSDARLVAKLIGLGTIDEETGKAVIKRAFSFLVKTDDPKVFAAVYSLVLLGSVRAELDWMKTFGKFIPQAPEAPSAGIEGEDETADKPVAWMHRPSELEMGQMLLELKQAGVLDSMMENAEATIDGEVIDKEPETNGNGRNGNGHV